jgi:hypothetical protein
MPGRSACPQRPAIAARDGVRPVQFLRHSLVCALERDDVRFRVNEKLQASSRRAALYHSPNRRGNPIRGAETECAHRVNHELTRCPRDHVVLQLRPRSQPNPFRLRKHLCPIAGALLRPARPDTGSDPHLVKLNVGLAQNLGLDPHVLESMQASRSWRATAWPLVPRLWRSPWSARPN